MSSISTMRRCSSGSDGPGTSSSSKARSTNTTASTSRMCDRNRLPSPSPCDAPSTRPPMSTNCTDAGTTFFDCAHLGQQAEPVVGHLGHADVGVGGGERVGRGERTAAGQRVVQRGLARVGESDESEAFHEGAQGIRPARNRSVQDLEHVLEEVGEPRRAACGGDRWAGRGRSAPPAPGGPGHRCGARASGRRRGRGVARRRRAPATALGSQDTGGPRRRLGCDRPSRFRDVQGSPWPNSRDVRDPVAPRVGDQDRLSTSRPPPTLRTGSAPPVGGRGRRGELDGEASAGSVGRDRSGGRRTRRTGRERAGGSGHDLLGGRRLRVGELVAGGAVQDR